MNLLWSIQRRLIFPRHLLRPHPRAGEGVAGLVRLHVGETEGWLLPGDGVSAERPGPAVLFAHGNGELIDHWPLELEPYRRLGVSVLLPEYRGYGRSRGEPSEEGITEDFVAFFELLAARPEIDRARLVFHGRSLGGGAVCALAARRLPAALVLQSTFTSIADLASAFGVPRFLIRDPFDNVAVLGQLDLPVLIVHGRRDEVIPFSHAEALAKAARRPTRITYDCRHNDCPPDPVRFWADVRSFLEGQGVLR